jgi:multicomponent Na+:H+ antiporter subunit B
VRPPTAPPRRTLRRGLFWFGAAGFAALFLRGVGRLPAFGSDLHPYGDRAVAVALGQRRTANTISSINFDQRGFDTLGEESILFAAVLGVVVLLRRAPDERRIRPRPQDVLPSTRLFGVVTLPLVALGGLYIVDHGQLSPGGGFQGGVILATALHVMYVASDYSALRRLRPLAVFELADSLGAIAFAVLGFAGLLAGSVYLADVFSLGAFNHLVSGGTVPLFNAAVGLEVGAGVIVVLARFLEQVLAIRPKESKEAEA